MDAFLGFVSCNPSGDNWFALSQSPGDAASGGGAGPNFTDAARDSWGLAVFNGRGQSSFATLVDAYGARQPQTVLGATVDPMRYTGQWSTITPSEWSHDTGWTFVIVDRNNPNVVWSRLEFVSIRAGAGFNLGNDRMLRALTAGSLHLVLHSGTPPTAANRITGGGYADVAITGPAGWELSSQEAIRVIQNNAELTFGNATNVWTRATHLGLWTGAAATGDLLWWDTILSFTARSGNEPKIRPRDLKIGLPNVV